MDGGVADPRRFIAVNELLTLVDPPAKADREVSPERAGAIRSARLSGLLGSAGACDG